MFEYQFKRSGILDVVVDGQVVSTFEKTKVSSYEFVTDNANELIKFLSDSVAIDNFLTWVEDGPGFRFDSDEQSISLILLNQIRSSTRIQGDLKLRANIIVRRMKSSSAQQLALRNKLGMTPIDQIALFAQEKLDLSPEDLELVQKAADAQKLALKARKYKDADTLMQRVFEVIEKYSDKLQPKYNVFEKGLKEADRIIRFKNWLDVMDSFRYLAMLSTPATFWGRNMVGNGVAQVGDITTDQLATILMKGSKIKKEVRRTIHN